MVGRGRVRAVVAAVAVASLLLSGRAVHLSFADGERYQAFAAEQHSGSPSSVAQGRGSIISADGRELATSLKADSVIANPSQIKDPASAAKSLAALIEPETGQDAKEIQAKLTTRNVGGDLAGYSVVDTVSPEVADKIKELALDGITLTPGFDRVYPDGEIASQLVGHLGNYGQAFGGVEARYDDALKQGTDVKLTVDTAVQQELQDALASSIKEYKGKSALGLVMRVDDGSVVALANYPSYDNNLYNEASAEAQRDRVLTDPYEPGSTFKPFTIASALEEGTLSENSAFTVPDSIQVADRVIHDSLPHETKVMTPANILQESSNVGTTEIAEDLGGKKIDEHLRRFGFGEDTGVDLWGEDPGAVPDYKDWSGSSIGNIPIGQGITVTPLQLAAGYSALANGGRQVTPYIARISAPESPGPRVISQGTSDIVRGMLQSVVDQGTGTYAHIPGYTVAGKTGTSQKVDPKTGTYGEDYTSSFIGFAPASDPKYLTLIVVDEPQTSIWGERVAAPAFQKVMGFTLSYFDVPPDAKPNEESQ
jgi:cell division protein FtsI (penicillin-binding protein 3)